jgi:hypothetical protein
MLKLVLKTHKFFATYEPFGYIDWTLRIYTCKWIGRL